MKIMSSSMMSWKYKKTLQFVTKIRFYISKKSYIVRIAASKNVDAKQKFSNLILWMSMSAQICVLKKMQIWAHLRKSRQKFSGVSVLGHINNIKMAVQNTLTRPMKARKRAVEERKCQRSWLSKKSSRLHSSFLFLYHWH